MDREWALLEAAIWERRIREEVVAKIKSSQEGLAFRDLGTDPELAEFQVPTISSKGPTAR